MRCYYFDDFEEQFLIEADIDSKVFQDFHDVLKQYFAISGLSDSSSIIEFNLTWCSTEVELRGTGGLL